MKVARGTVETTCLFLSCNRVCLIARYHKVQRLNDMENQVNPGTSQRPWNRQPESPVGPAYLGSCPPPHEGLEQHGHGHHSDHDGPDEPPDVDHGQGHGGRLGFSVPWSPDLTRKPS